MNCNRCKYENRYINEKPCSECVHAYMDKFVSKTNYDKVMEMSVDELVEFWDNVTSGRKKIDREYRYMTGKNPDSKKIIKKWLESETVADG